MITADTFVGELRDAIPECADAVAEHLADYDELLLHLIMSDLLRLTVESFEAGRVDFTDRLLAFVDRCLREGDAAVVNSVEVSYVEHFGAYPGESDGLLARWPRALRAALTR